MNTLVESCYAKMANAKAPDALNASQYILLVEDDPIILNLSSRFLARSGYSVETAKDGLEGWKAVNAKKFDLLITDHDMPGLTGVELIKKSRLARMSLPIILVSGVFPTEEVEKHPWLHLAATMLKPFSLDQLLNTVKEVLLAASLNPNGIVIKRTTMAKSPITLQFAGKE
jgi:DNA-binding response OmpR family regulator